mmetsp:Transcript_15552/g.27894  ORF Transcript_15552/g.27894 Transcript_15552/m.27894 type:complete len:117 (+) Transcript_15552:666-1016(+)
MSLLDCLVGHHMIWGERCLYTSLYFACHRFAYRSNFILMGPPILLPTPDLARNHFFNFVIPIFHPCLNGGELRSFHGICRLQSEWGGYPSTWPIDLVVKFSSSLAVLEHPVLFGDT